MSTVKKNPAQQVAILSKPDHHQVDGIIHMPPDKLTLYEGNPKVHDEKQLNAIMVSIKEFGFTGAIVTNEEGMVLAGHGRLEAAKRLGLQTVPTRVATGLSKAKQRAFILADNKISEMSGWDNNKLKFEMSTLLKEDFNIEVTGFSTAEIDILMDDSPQAANDPDDLKPEDIVVNPVSKLGDVWKIGKHMLACGSALEPASYDLVMGGDKAQMVITDPPYNVPINGHVGGSGSIKHEEFSMASGEMDEGEFTDFLGASFSLMKEFSKNGALVFSFMDWRHQKEILGAGESVFGPTRQLCVWNKNNGGMGTFYRSQHELVYIFKNGNAQHINNFALGQYGRYRTNVWNYPGMNGFQGNELLKLHPTVKPVSMIADAIRDCSARNGIILDPFAGSGTILIAAERTGRRARAIELEPKYVDVGIRRWERLTGKSAIHVSTGLTFAEMATVIDMGRE